MKTVKEYQQEGQAHDQKRKRENKEQLAAGNKIYKLAKEIATEHGISEKDAEAVVLETYPELARQYYGGIRRQEHLIKSYERR